MQKELSPLSPSSSSTPSRWKSISSSVFSRSTLLTFVLAQFLSLLLTGTGIFSTELATRGVNIPTSQSFLHYFLLTITYGSAVLVRYFRQQQQHSPDIISSSLLHGKNSEHESEPECISEQTAEGNLIEPEGNEIQVENDGLRGSPIMRQDSHSSINSNANRSPTSSFSQFLSLEPWKYAILALCDVEGNYCVVKAYQYTTITSVMLLDCFTIPFVMIISRIFMKTKYNRWQLSGVLICLIGLCLLVLSDIERENETGSNILLGDSLCILGSFFYAVSNCGQEAFFKDKKDKLDDKESVAEYLGCVGFFAMLINGSQLAILEREELISMVWKTNVFVFIIGFAACLFCFYSFVPLLLRRSSATYMNIAFLSSDCFAIIANVFLFGVQPSLLFFVAFLTIISGICLYNYLPLRKQEAARDGAALSKE